MALNVEATEEMTIPQRMNDIVRPSSPRIHPVPLEERDAESRAHR